MGEVTTTFDAVPNYITKSDIICLNRFIVITKVVEDETTGSGLLLSANDKDEMRYKKGIVVSVGANVTPNTLIKGDTILYDEAGAHDIRLNGIIYTLIQEQHAVLCFPRS